jgi:class 3 adenylate cyclase
MAAVPQDQDLPRAPRSVPPRLVDVILIVLAALFWAGMVAGNVVIFEDAQDEARIVGEHWDARAIAAVALLPSVVALWWRRRHPVRVLAISLAMTLAAFPFAAFFGIFALHSTASRVSQRKAIVAAVVSMGIVFAGHAIWHGAPAWDDVVLVVVATAVVTALGLYTGARRAYFDRLRERALFARALASFLPAGVAELIEASPSALSLEEEIEATVLFSDIRGFSAVAEQLAPRAVADVVGRHASAMAEVVLSHGGMLDKFAGDGVMAVFGAPKPLPGDADRAIACAVAMQQRQAELNAEAPGAGYPPTEIGIGVNTGLVIAGTVGGAGRLDYTVIGDAVNVAQRLQSEARSGEILVSSATAEQCTWPQAEAAGARQLKGRKEPVDVFRIGWNGSQRAG